MSKKQVRAWSNRVQGAGFALQSWARITHKEAKRGPWACCFVLLSFKQQISRKAPGALHTKPLVSTAGTAVSVRLKASSLSSNRTTLHWLCRLVASKSSLAQAELYGQTLKPRFQTVELQCVELALFVFVEWLRSVASCRGWMQNTSLNFRTPACESRGKIPYSMPWNHESVLDLVFRFPTAPFKLSRPPVVHAVGSFSRWSSSKTRHAHYEKC